jgi:hypothetical protein
MTQAMATTGSSATIHPATPPPASASITASGALMPPSPRLMASTMTRALSTT